MTVLDCSSQAQQVVELEAGVPQGFVLGPFLFLMVINDPPSWEILIYADDMTLLAHGLSRMGAERLMATPWWWPGLKITACSLTRGRHNIYRSASRHQV